MSPGADQTASPVSFGIWDGPNGACVGVEGSCGGLGVDDSLWLAMVELKVDLEVPVAGDVGRANDVVAAGPDSLSVSVVVSSCVVVIKTVLVFTSGVRVVVDGEAVVVVIRVTVDASWSFVAVVVSVMVKIVVTLKTWLLVAGAIFDKSKGRRGAGRGRTKAGKSSGRIGAGRGNTAGSNRSGGAERIVSRVDDKGEDATEVLIAKAEDAVEETGSVDRSAAC